MDNGPRRDPLPHLIGPVCLPSLTAINWSSCRPSSLPPPGHPRDKDHGASQGGEDYGAHGMSFCNPGSARDTCGSRPGFVSNPVGVDLKDPRGAGEAVLAHVELQGEGGRARAARASAGANNPCVATNQLILCPVPAGSRQSQ